MPCRAPGDETRAVTDAADVDRQGADETDGQAPQQFYREPGEPGAAGQSKSIHGKRARSCEGTLPPNKG